MPVDLDAAGKSMARDAREYRRCGSCSGGVPPRRLPSADDALPDFGPPDSARLPMHGFLPGIDVPEFDVGGHGPSPGGGNGVLGRLDRYGDSEPATTQVDIFMSAGPNNGADSSCNMENNLTCKLYRVRWDIHAQAAVEVELVVDQTLTSSGSVVSPVEPAVSPSGASLAFLAQRADGGGDEIRSVALTARGTSGVAATRTTMSRNQPQWPDWYDDDFLLMDTDPGAGRNTAYQATMWVGVPDGSTAPVGLLGPGAFTQTEEGFENPRTHQDPRHSGAGVGPRVVTFGGPLVGEPGHEVAQHVPRVHNLFGLDMEEFDLGDPAFTECHHPDWNPEGSRILCTRYQDPEKFAGGTSFHGTSLNDYWQRLLYAFEYDGATGTWRSAGRLFEPLTARELQGTFSGYDTPSGHLYPQQGVQPGGCETYVYKFGHWCGSDRYVVVTLYCHDKDEVMVSSRVILIDTHEGHVRYFDVTAPVEDLEGAPHGAYHAGASACRHVTEGAA